MTDHTDHIRVFEGVGDVTYEDGGQAAIIQIDGDDERVDGEFVRVQSWRDGGERQEHIWLRSLDGKRIRITVEVS